VRAALEAMQADETARERLAAGAFDADELIALSADEQRLVQDAAVDMPDVSGFTVIKFGDIEGESTHKDHKGEIEVLSMGLGGTSLRWQAAVRYGFRR
jgi:hypothetical protein